MSSQAQRGRVRILRYDLDDFPFPQAVNALPGQEADVSAGFYTHFGEIRPLYERFLREVIAPQHAEDLCVQAIPTFRVHRPGGMAVKEFHRDSDYNHQPGITNYWLPLTKAFDTNSIWIETDPDSGDFAPAELGPGEVLQFDAVSLRHGNYPNGTGVTRLSFDFRVVPYRIYQDSELASVATGRRLALGDYYTLLTWPGR